MRTLEMVYPELPPTSNRIYFSGTRLTQHAREYSEKFSHYMFREYGAKVMELDKNGIFAVHMRFFFDVLENSSWNNTEIPPSKQAKTRYKRIDLTNRIKLIEDCIRDLIDIDDSQTFAASQEKHQDPGRERVEILIQQISPADFGLVREVNFP